jgi:hypothetical protein
MGAMAMRKASQRIQRNATIVRTPRSRVLASAGTASPSPSASSIAGKPRVMPSIIGQAPRTPCPAALAATISTFGPGVTEAAMAKPMAGRRSMPAIMTASLT